MDAHFEYLTGVINVPATVPAKLTNDGLGQFYLAPNDEEWGASLCRVLYHESIHFWQLFSSAYVANIVDHDWIRLQHFRDTGQVQPLGERAKEYGVRAEGKPFSPRELLECWARFWDAHTRGPAAIFHDEGYPVEDMSLETVDPYMGFKSYTAAAYDYVMTEGPDAGLYERPYRWLLDQSKHSAFVAVTFPMLVHAAFGTPDPVGLFCEAFDRAWSSPSLRKGIDSNRSGNINIDWLNLWMSVRENIVEPTMYDLQLPPFITGKDVIRDSALGTHPVYREYLQQYTTLGFRLERMKVGAANGPTPSNPSEIYVYAMADLPQRDFWAVFGLPGQPDYRHLLGVVFRPVQVRFENYVLDGRRPMLLGLQALNEGGDDTYATVLEDLVPLVQRFRFAEYAVSKGLPVDAFE